MSPKGRRALIIIAVTVIAVTVGGYLIAPWFGFLAGVSGLLALVALFDNEQGNFLPVALLVVVVLAIIAVMMTLMAVTLRR